MCGFKKFCCNKSIDILMLYGKDDIGNKGALMRSLVKFLKKYDLYLNDFKDCYSLERNLKHKNPKSKQSKYKFDHLGKVVRACPMMHRLHQNSQLKQGPDIFGSHLYPYLILMPASQHMRMLSLF